MADEIRSSATELRFVYEGEQRRIAAAWSCWYGPPLKEDPEAPDGESTWWLRGWDLEADDVRDFRMADITEFRP